MSMYVQPSYYPHSQLSVTEIPAPVWIRRYLAPFTAIAGWAELSPGQPCHQLVNWFRLRTQQVTITAAETGRRRKGDMFSW